MNNRYQENLRLVGEYWLNIANCKKNLTHLDRSLQRTQLPPFLRIGRLRIGRLRIGRKSVFAVYYGCRKNTHDRPTTPC